MNTSSNILRAPLLASILVLAGAAVADRGGAVGHPPNDRAVSLVGTVVDVNCFAIRRAASIQGEVAAACRDGAPGHPAGLMVHVDGRERLYILATPPMALTHHMGRTARLEGASSPLGEHLIKPDRLEVDAGGGWQPVALMPDM